MRHAGPTQVSVRLTRIGTGVELLVENLPGPGPSIRVPGSGSGLAGMRARAEVHDGSLEACPTPSGGFRVRAVIPWP
ncbi:sensor histidine kinase [Nonomuraea sp. NPDC049480]|uniref:sensor histidine kinase n=1 Tax=Nonomuraea sp. NPDC049480 TaxID=3364353 RepID=UPI00378D1BD7